LIISHSNQYIIAWNALDKIICLFSSHIYLYMGAFLSKDLEKNDVLYKLDIFFEVFFGVSMVLEFLTDFE
jgi:hypothetical protein